MIKTTFAAALMSSLLLTGCGMGGMARSMQPVVEGFEEGERVSRDIRGNDRDRAARDRADE